MTSVGDIISALWILWVAYWIAMARGNKRTAVRVNRAWRLLGLVAVVTAYIVMRHYPEYFGGRLVHPSPLLNAIGVVATAAGLLFSIWARRILGTNWSATPTIKEGHELVESGPYRLVRHPIYTGILLAVLGTSIAGDRIWNACAFGLTAFLLIWKLKIEENLMLRQFPQAYPEYRRRTKALIPYVF